MVEILTHSASEKEFWVEVVRAGQHAIDNISQDSEAGKPNCKPSLREFPLLLRLVKRREVYRVPSLSESALNHW